MRALLHSMAEAVQADDECVTFAATQIDNLPLVARLGVQVLAWVFAMHALVHGGKAFAEQTVAQRQGRLAAWRQSALAPCRNFVILCEGLMRFAHHAKRDKA